VTYKRPTARILDDRSGTGAPVTLGAVLDVRKGDRHWIMRPGRNYYEATDGSGGPFGRFFMGESTSEVDVRWGLGRDVWTAVQPDISGLSKPISVANRKFASSPRDVQAVVVAALVASYRNHPPPATFRMIVSPMIVWIWIGGAIVLLGSLTALWPTAEARRRRAASLAAARLGRELSRA
jgi:cytochrome c-type biogenesis protein CcmF